ncbi:MAG: HTTM domain-containing protein [Methylococcaceae bacterium]|nr:HTTM domain-containing protein [Methylococcaceae bacterium]
MVSLQEIAFLIYFRHLIFDRVPYIETAGPIATLCLLIWFGIMVCLIFGLFTVFCSIANYCFWVLFVLLTPMWHDFDGGFDQLMTSSSFILIFIHSERRFSLDNLRLELNSAAVASILAPDTRVPVIYYHLVLGISLGLLYFDAGLHKLHSEIWLNGLGVWVPNTMPYYISPSDLDWFVDNRRVQTLIGYSLIIFQLVFLFLFTHRFFRVPLLVIGVLFHLGIVLCLNIYPFGFGMLVHYILLVPFKWWTGLARTIEYQEPFLHTYCSRADRASLRLAVILQHFDFRKYSAFHFVSDFHELPESIRKAHSDFSAFALASYDRNNKLYMGDDAFREKIFFRILFGILRIADTAGFHCRRSLAAARNCSTRFSRRVGVLSFGILANRAIPASEVSLKSIVRFLMIVLILQANSTLHYGLLKRSDGYAQPNIGSSLVSEISVYITSISHLFLGITPHALYMDNHFDGYEQISALTYIDSRGQEQWVPFVAPDGRFVSPNWGRIHSMWANVAMHPPFDRPVFERLSMKVTAYWANKLDLGTRDSTFRIKTKPVQISYRWMKDLRRKNLSGQWSDFAQIRWIDGRFSIRYGSQDV